MPHSSLLHRLRFFSNRSIASPTRPISGLSPARYGQSSDHDLLLTQPWPRVTTFYLKWSISSGRYHQTYTRNGSHVLNISMTPDDKKLAVMSIQTLELFQHNVQYPRIRDGMTTLSDEETDALIDLLRRMLAFNSTDRPTAAEVLESEWMIRWARPELLKLVTS